MGKNWQEDIASENFKIYKENVSYRHPWERDANIFENFRYNTHFSRSEEAEMLAMRLAPVPVSITTAICDSADALMVSNRPTLHVAPIIHPFNEEYTQISKKVAQKYNFLIKKSWYDSLGSLQYDRVIRDSTNVGHGLFYITPRVSHGEFNVDIKHLNWRYFFPHPSTKDPFYQDMDNCVIGMRISPKSGFKFVKPYEPDMTFDEYKDKFVAGSPGYLERVAKNKYDFSSKRSEGVLYLQRLQLEDETVYLVRPLKVEVNQSGEIPFKVYTEYTDELKAKEAAGEVKIIQERRFVLVEYTSVGSLGYKQVYPIENYNIVPLVHDHRDTPYPIGRVWYLYPMQRALNKFVMTAILNGALTNATRVIEEEGSIVNGDEWDKNFTRPGARLKWKPMIPGQSKPPSIIEGQPLSDAWMQFPRQIMHWMEYVSGQFGLMQGDPSGAPDVFSTVASLQSAGGQKIKRRLIHADAALSIVGERVAEFYKNYAPPNGFATFIDEQGKQSDPELYNVLRPKTNADGSRDIEIVPDTDLSIGFDKVRFITQGSTGFEAGTEAALMTTLATQMSIPELVPHILKRLNISDVDKVLEGMDIKNQQAQTIEQQQEMIKNLDSRTKILMNQVEQKGMDTKIAQFEAQLDKYLNQIKSKIEGQV